MAKLYLKFGDKVLKEITLTRGIVTIGRLPDNLVRIDNPGVSGRHAKIYWDNNQFVVEDTNSSNGTFLNGQRVSKSPLKDGDSVLVGKHVLEFSETARADAATAEKALDRSSHWQEQVSEKAAPRLEPTAFMDSGRAAQMIAAGAPTAGVQPRRLVGVLTVTGGKAEHRAHTLGSKLTMIGKSEMATIRLKGWFAPDVAATITMREDCYLIAPSGQSKVEVNDTVVSGPTELKPGDRIEVGGLKATFNYSS